MSAQGFLGHDQLLSVQREMIDSGKGEFEGGRFFAIGAKQKGERGKDGFEAVWEQCNNQPLTYPEPKYETPVLTKPQNFGWKECGEKAWRKHLGSFTERETRIEMVRVESGGLWTNHPENALHFWFVVNGEGSLDGKKIGFEDAIRLEANEAATIQTESRLEFLRIVVPTLVE